MNIATKNLENDHVNILRLIDVMEEMIRVGNKNPDYFEQVIQLIRSYADGVHHAKEETMLFPMMGKRGFSAEQGPVAVMLHEHSLGRNYVKGMAEGMAKYRDGNEAVVPVIFGHMQGYIELLRNHIAKENNVLFRMADNVLSENDQQELFAAFTKLENCRFCGGILQNGLKNIAVLESTFKN